MQLYIDNGFQRYRWQTYQYAGSGLHCREKFRGISNVGATRAKMAFFLYPALSLQEKVLLQINGIDGSVHFKGGKLRCHLSRTTACIVRIQAVVSERDRTTSTDASTCCRSAVRACLFEPTFKV